jgi:hypothetical protein
MRDRDARVVARARGIVIHGARRVVPQLVDVALRPPARRVARRAVILAGR